MKWIKNHNRVCFNQKFLFYLLLEINVQMPEPLASKLLIEILNQIFFDHKNGNENAES
jgi:hypothetical protein